MPRICMISTCTVSRICVYFGSNIDRYSFLSFVLYALVFLIRVVLVDFMIRFAARRVHFVVEFCVNPREFIILTRLETP